VTLGVAASAASAFALGAKADPPWGPETPPFNIEVILRDVSGGSGLATSSSVSRTTTRRSSTSTPGSAIWRRAAPTGSLRAVDTTLDGSCPRVESDWVTLGRGTAPRAITTDVQGTGREDLSRDLGAAPPGRQFDINFRVIDAGNAPVLESGCYRFTVDL
jgi:hypothetical protein